MVTPVAPCFLKGTKISTTEGEIEVEKLTVGDRVLSSDNKAVTIKFIGKRHLVKSGTCWQENNEPVIIKKDAFSGGAPKRDLYVSPEHAIYLDGLLFKAKELVNNKTIIRMGETAVDEIDYFHIDLGFHDIIYAENLATESFGGASRENFDNFLEYHRLYGHSQTKEYQPFAPFAYSFKQTAASVGSRMGKHLPRSIYRLGKPLALKCYQRLDRIEHKFFAKR